MTMDTNKIREALDAAIVYAPENEDLMTVVTSALAELDKAQQPGKVLTDEWVKARAMEIYPPDEVNDGHPWYGHRRAIEDSAARHMVRHLHKQGYLAPAAGLTVEEMVKEVDAWIQEHIDEIGFSSATNALRSRLTAAQEAKKKP